MIILIYGLQGALAFYKGFLPNFGRLGSWNVIMFLTLEQVRFRFMHFSFSAIVIRMFLSNLLLAIYAHSFQNSRYSCARVFGKRYLLSPRCGTFNTFVLIVYKGVGLGYFLFIFNPKQVK